MPAAPDGLQIDLSAHQAAFVRMAAFSKKTLPVLLRDEARICFGGSGTMPGVAGITPPYGEGGLQNARTAEAHAKAKVAADIYSLYGTPSDAYDTITERAPEKAPEFWWLFKHGDIPGASAVMREATGSIIHAFDDGVLHRRNFRKRSRAARSFRFFVSDPQNLKAYVQLEQEMVWWLASGWQEPLEALGAKLPSGVKRHNAPGHLEVVINDREISITVSNDVRYAGAIGDMRRRIRTVMNEWRVERLDRSWNDFLTKLSSTSGFAQK